MESDSDALLTELAHVFHTPLTGVTAGAELLGRLVPELRARQGDPLKELVKRNSATLKRRIDAILSMATVEGETVVLRLTRADIKRVHCVAAEEVIEIPDGEPRAAAVTRDAGPATAGWLPTSHDHDTSVLVADDEKDVRSLMVTALRDQGYRVIEARNGAEAMEKIAESRPRVIILDGLMPKVGGFDVCKQVRALDPAYQPKIMIVTAVYKKKSYEYEAVGLGADEYLTKPFEVEDQLERVGRLAGRTAVATGAGG